ncbi:hypothetical protein BLA9940_02274 [Burkholderia aenigmatica]|uniref:Uncharacterized protein n=1 Tax=Burkholderia aenigmatica TaxID=2015348 RepID=A0A6J5IZX3_9BURK|nr:MULTISPECIES: hypothetical protein [Burkholderia]UKD14588.1 hypothetical protein L3V59_33540 [Burkholderia aenigmatica]CAB3964890.1 hypothetical protein BLA3211_03123 [Burkholderia aenigmatica]VWC55196.1 hypothetical protein BLA9940_02274 [Burkholderia aenigmatica]VWC83978.1 hypothetical protein BLA17378_04115 [Burkholderia aenigmatica]VWD52211.1 hypothetical protein BLA18628_06165 [Burkholderia aenigmatica]
MAQAQGKVTPKNDSAGVEVNICQPQWIAEQETFKIANSPPRTANLTFSGADLNYLARVLYAESSGAGILPDESDRRIEKEALLNVFYFRLNRKGYPRNDYIAKTFSMVCNAAGQFDSLQPKPRPKFINSGNPKYKALGKSECSDLQESIDAVQAFIAGGPNSKYIYDNFRSRSARHSGTIIGNSKFWLSELGKEESDAVR